MPIAVTALSYQRSAISAWPKLGVGPGEAPGAQLKDLLHKNIR
jgi:hypothetical protein